MKATQQVTVMGRKISVKSSSSAEKVRAIESFVNRRLQEVGAALKSGDAQLVLMLALLNTAEEMLELRAAQQAAPVVDNTRLQSLIEKLETL
ncbi:MAG TPA: cell division protein ZapA [Desulfuromonadales bacterium]|nr:cell division protein ZapA [Desulfuromonadales bacterium]